MVHTLIIFDKLIHIAIEHVEVIEVVVLVHMITCYEDLHENNFNFRCSSCCCEKSCVIQALSRIVESSVGHGDDSNDNSRGFIKRAGVDTKLVPLSTEEKW